MFLMISCGDSNQTASKQPSDAAINAAIPDGDTLQTTALSNADQAKLSKAIGRQAKPINYKQLQELMNTPEDILYIYNFWKLDCTECLALNEKLLYLVEELGESQIKLILVNLDYASKTNELNTFIRANNIFTDVFQLAIPFDTKNWQQKLINAWDGKLPATLFLRKGEGVDLFYQYNFKADELEAIVDPLLL